MITSSFNMQLTIRVLSSRAHQPLIKFLGKRSYPSGTRTPPPLFVFSFFISSPEHTTRTSSRTRRAEAEVWRLRIKVGEQGSSFF